MEKLQNIGTKSAIVPIKVLKLDDISVLSLSLEEGKQLWR